MQAECKRGVAYANDGFIQPAPTNGSCMTALALVILKTFFMSSIKDIKDVTNRQCINKNKCFVLDSYYGGVVDVP